jgi:hypothetical protein
MSTDMQWRRVVRGIGALRTEIEGPLKAFLKRRPTVKGCFNSGQGSSCLSAALTARLFIVAICLAAKRNGETMIYRCLAAGVGGGGGTLSGSAISL